MSDELLDYYNQELTYLRRLGAEFGAENPKIAGRLGLDRDAIEDPHVARLVESFAFLTARIRRKLDDDFPELSEALLDTLYPHYLAPIPSMTIVQFDAQAESTGPVRIPRGTMLETEPVSAKGPRSRGAADQVPCRFRTTFETTLWPMWVETAALVERPFSFATTPRAESSDAVVRIVLRCAKQATIRELNPKRLRFFITGTPRTANHLYELLLNRTVDVALGNDPDDRRPVSLGPGALLPVGFASEDGMLPYSPRSYLGYRLVTEFFAFPQKFLFFDVAIPTPSALSQIGSHLELLLYVRDARDLGTLDVTESSFALGCTPAVNLYTHRADPLTLTGHRSEYRIEPDARHPLAHEIYTLEKIVPVKSGRASLRPLHSLEHGVSDEGDLFWYGRRRRAPAGTTGTEMYLSLVDASASPTGVDVEVSVETTSLNRDLPGRLQFGPGRPKISLLEAGAAVAGLRCLTPPTPTLRPALGRGSAWRLVSHLALNHLSLAGGADGALALKEILRLYDFRDAQESRQMIEGVTSITSEPASRRLEIAGRSTIAAGAEVRVELDRNAFPGSVFLFASVMRQFFAHQATINSFIQLVARLRGREEDLRRWPPQVGDRPIV
jgi:type VI secretion system protein ImpG